MRLIQLQEKLIRLQLDYYDQFWPLYRKDIQLERMQKIFTRMLPRLKSLSYRERFDTLGLFSFCKGG